MGMGREPLLLGHWHPAAGEGHVGQRAEPESPEPDPAGTGPPDDVTYDDPPFATHLHGRELMVVHEGLPGHWHWRVTSPHGAVLAEGDAPTRDAAEQAAEDEATAVHPPTDSLLDLLLS
jgi:hypothetical protein